MRNVFLSLLIGLCFSMFMPLAKASVQIKEAINIVNEGVSLDSREIDTLSTMLSEPSEFSPEQYERGVVALADHYERHNKLTLAIKVLLEGIRLLPVGSSRNTFLMARNRLRIAAGNWYNKIGEHHTAQRHYDDALDDAIAANSDYAKRLTYFNMGTNLIDLHQYASAINMLNYAYIPASSSSPTLDSISWRSMAMIAYAHFFVHEFSSAKSIALTAWDYGTKNNMHEHEFMEYYATIIAVGEATEGNVFKAKQWDSKIVTDTAALVDNPKHLNVRITRLEQQQDPLNTLLGYITLYERFKNEFLTRMNETHLKDLMAYETQRFENEAAATQARADINNKLLAQNQHYQSYLFMTIAGALCTGAFLCIMIVKESRFKSVLQRQALEDPLTHAPNRRAVTSYAKRCISEAMQKSPSGLGIALIDLDHFKTINDAYGHDIGDKVLVHFYEIAQKSLRKQDMIGRYGGEEFLLVLPNANEQDIRCLFERLQQTLKANPLLDDAFTSPITTTISMGATRYMPSPLKNKRTPALSSLVSMADSHVYMAKKQGRDQIVIA